MEVGVQRDHFVPKPCPLPRGPCPWLVTGAAFSRCPCGPQVRTAGNRPGMWGPPCEESVSTNPTTLFLDKWTRRPLRGTSRNPVV